MAASFKYNGLYFAIVTIIAVVGVYESTYLLFLLVPLVGWLLFKRIAKAVVFSVILLALVAFAYFSLSIQETDLDMEKPQLMTVSGGVKINGQSMRGFMKTEQNESVYFSYQLKSEQEKQWFSERSLAGLRFIVAGQLDEEESSAHRYAFNMQTYLKSKDSIGPLTIQSLQFYDEEKSLLYTLAKQRFNVKQHIEQTFPKTLVAEAQALLIGLQDNVDGEMTRAYQKLGITHLFAISGLHIALLSFLFYQVLLRCRIRVEISTISLLVILPLYAILAGGAPSVWRAVAVVLFIAAAKFIKWHVPIEDALSYSCVFFLLFTPHVLYQIGFQLSYLATFSLIFSSRILMRSSNLFIQNFYMTLVSQLIVYPLLLLHFYEMSLSSFIANIFFVPLFSFIILPMNIVLLLLSYYWKFGADFLFALYEPCREMLAHLVLLLMDIPYQMWVPGKPTIMWMVFLYVSVVIALYMLDKRARLIQISGILLIPALIFSYRFITDDALHISYINVGQGDSILIELPRRKEVYLIDSGGLLRFNSETWKERNELYEVGRQIVVPYLKGKGIASLDKLVITHADADHVEGAEELLREIHVHEIHITPNSGGDSSMADLLAEAKRRQVPLKEKSSGESWRVGETEFHYLWPFDTEYKGNNDSLVLLLGQGSFRAIFTGDLEAEGEAELLEHYGPYLKDLTIVKAGHHGSKTSSSEAFVAHTNAQLTIFTAGKNNRYNHPAKEVVKRYEARGLPYLVTGLDGTIEVLVENERVTYRNWAQEYAQKKKASSH